MNQAQLEKNLAAADKISGSGDTHKLIDRACKVGREESRVAAQLQTEQVAADKVKVKAPVEKSPDSGPSYGW